MPSARELLERADALMRRNRSPLMDDIPVLTDAVPEVRPGRPARLRPALPERVAGRKGGGVARVWVRRFAIQALVGKEGEIELLELFVIEVFGSGDSVELFHKMEQDRRP